MKKKKNWLDIILIILIVAGLAGTFTIIKVNNSKKEPEIITTSTLEKIIDASELSTFEAIYNGIAVVKNPEKDDKVDYYVSYKAKVQAGIDFDRVEMSIDDEKKQIVVKIPAINLGEPMVDIASMDYIFENKKANTETVSEQAYKACIEDAKNESEKEEAIFTLAKQNAENIIRALINPFIEDMEETYELVIE